MSDARHRYMLERSLFLIAGDAEAWWTPLKSALTVQAAGHRREGCRLPLLEDALRLCNLASLLSYAHASVLSACDYDLPFAVHRREVLVDLSDSADVDVGASLDRGMLSDNMGISLCQERWFGHPAARFIARTLHQLLAFANAELAILPRPSLRHNPVVTAIAAKVINQRDILHNTLLLRKDFAAAAKRSAADVPPSPQIALRHRSVRNALILQKLMRSCSGTIGAGLAFNISVRPTLSRLYEYWCFAEFTRALVRAGRGDVLQRNAIRAHQHRPVFSFSNDVYFYYQHSGNRLVTSDEFNTILDRAYPSTRPDWILFAPLDRADSSAIFECKYVKNIQREIAGRQQLTEYCLDYAFNKGILFSAREERGHRGRQLNAVSLTRPGGGGIELATLSFIPDPAFEGEHSRALSSLIDWLLS